MIFLTNEQIQQVLDMKTCIDAMEEAYRDLNQQHAGYRPRIDFYVPQEPHYYRWGTMEGASRKLGVFAIRMKSDMLAWENQDGFMVEDKYCMERGRYCGLIFLTQHTKCRTSRDDERRLSTAYARRRLRWNRHKISRAKECQSSRHDRLGRNGAHLCGSDQAGAADRESCASSARQKRIAKRLPLK